ncbi:MAG: hypothetical protein IKC95_05195 [Oscillospiraceae bacterium]|nr:hypothetical protein [Oscillospiraceae bacterium]
MSNRNNNLKRSETLRHWRGIWNMIYRLRSIILAIPVVAGALFLAIHNQAKLPAMVGFNILQTGEYAQMVAREIAVLGPLALTAVCLLLMFCSRKVLYPWLISLFSLALPVLIYVTNVFPG